MFLSLALPRKCFSALFLPRKHCPRKCFSTRSSLENVSPPQGMICCCWLLALLCCLPQAFIFTTREGYDRKIISFQMFKLSEWVWQQKVLLVMTGYDKKIISFQMWSEWVSLTTEGTSSNDRVWQENWIIPNVQSEWVSLTTEGTSSHNSDPTIKSHDHD